LWLERLIGHIITMLIFAVVGYLMLSHFRPDLFPGWFGHGRQQNERKQTDESP